MAQKKSIDEIWKELNQRPAPRGNVTASNGIMASLGGSSSLPGITSISRTLPGTDTIMSSSAPSSDQGVGVRHSSHYDPMLAGVTPEALQSFLSSIQRTVNCLSDPDRSTRKRAASSLQGRLKSGDSSGPPPDPAMLQALICGPLLQPLVSALQDYGEAVRLTSAEIFCNAALTVPDFSPALPALVPEIVTRMGKLPVLEPAEEVRLQLASLVSAISQTSSRSTLEQYSPDLCTFILRALEDPFHEINKVACSCLRSISSTLSSSPSPNLPSSSSSSSSTLSALEHSGEKLLTALMPGLQHPHSKVRLEMIEALGAILYSPPAPAPSPSPSPSTTLMGCINLNLVETTLAPSLRPVAYDKAHSVRRALFISLATWLGYRRPPGATDLDDGYSSPLSPINPHAMPRAISSHLLPLLLIGVTDPHPPLASLALQLVEGIGIGWEGGRGEAQALPPPSPSPSPSMMDVDENPSPPTHDDDSAVLACQLGPPYQGRPGVGARSMSKDLLPLLLPPLLSEVGEWTLNQRVCASRQLHTLLVLSEDGCVQQLPKLLVSLCQAIGDESVEVASRVVSCVHVIGAHVKPDLWLPLMLDNTSNDKLSLTQRANTLVVLSGLLHTCAKVHTLTASSATEPLLVTLAVTLAGDEMRASEHPAIRAQLLSCCINLTRWLASSRASPESRGSIGKPLYSLLLQLYGFEKDPSKLGGVNQAMSEIAPACGCSSFETLADLHGPLILLETTQVADRWTSDSPSYLTFRALLLTSGASTLGRMTQRVCESLGPLLGDAEGDSALRLSVLDLLDQVMEDKERGPSFLSGSGAEGGASQLRVMTSLIMPPLVWIAGKTAAAIRFRAMTALCTLLRNKLASPSTLQSLVITEPGASNPKAREEKKWTTTTSLLPLIIQSLDEDWYVDLRDVSCRVMEFLMVATGPGLSEEGRRLIYPELIKRLDDSSNLVRVAACRALVAFSSTMPPTYCDTNSGYLAQGVVIHMDDSCPEVQEAACKVLEALGAVKPVAVAQEVIKVKEMFRSKHYIDRVLTACYQSAHK